MISVLDEREADELLEGAIRTLERAGILVQDAGLLNALLDQGARVDLETERAWIPPNLLSRVIEAQSRSP